MGGDQKLLHIIFLYKNIFSMLCLGKIWIRGWKKEYAIFDNILFESTLHDCSETGFVFLEASNKKK